ncbi:haloacid dehalogenase [Geomonas limicola]|uniref:phosphoglycolate phosphatase n=1 Tax=Geomonas limicola TaxID=2740186 RepID=A0A6V8N550_9BACT|nr:haloacid dehalogenase [Geomonas limicola]
MWAIVFDLDGTLYVDDRLGEEVHQSACRYVADLRGISPDQAQDELQRARSCPSDSGGTLSRAVVALGGTLQELHRRFSEDIHPEQLLAPDPRVQRLLEHLGERYELYVYTNNNRSLSGRIMAQLAIRGYFKEVFTIEDSWRPKPDRAVLTGILESIGRTPGETLFVGDRYQVDLELPQSLGCAILETRTIEELLTLGQLLD